MLLFLICFVAGSVLGAEEWQVAKLGGTRFMAFDVFVDSGTNALAAWQLDFRATKGDVKIVGIEGGEHGAFKEPPHYDPKAMQHERVRLAAFSTAADLPHGKTRVATIHVQVTGSTEPQFTIRVEAAAQADGAKITLQAHVQERRKP